MGRRRIVLDQPIRRIIGMTDDLGGKCLDTIAYGMFQQAKLVRVEERYALYREQVPSPTEDDGA